MGFKLRATVVSFALITVVSAALGAAPVGHASATEQCGVVQANHFTVNDAEKTITGSFRVKGPNGCTMPVSVMTWFAKVPMPGEPVPEDFFTSQRVNDVSSGRFGVGIHTLTAKLPLCSTDPTIVAGYQADVVASDKPSPVLTNPGTGGFYDQPQPDGGGMTVDAYVYAAKCPAPKPPVTPTPPTTPTPPVAPVTPVQPAALVNTGAGDVVGIFAAATVAAAFMHRVMTRRQYAK
jgi:hypothetical protein